MTKKSRDQISMVIQSRGDIEDYGQCMVLERDDIEHQTPWFPHNVTYGTCSIDATLI